MLVIFISLSPESYILTTHMKTNGNYLTLAGLTLGIILMTGCGRKSKNEMWIPEKARNLASATAYINERCPEMVDVETRLDSVLLSQEGELVFFYTLPKRESPTIDPVAFEAFMMPEILDNIRTNPDLRMHRDSSLTMVFIYRGSKGERIAELSLGPEYYR